MRRGKKIAVQTKRRAAKRRSDETDKANDAPARVPDAPALRSPRFLTMKLEPMKRDEEMARHRPSVWSCIGSLGVGRARAPTPRLSLLLVSVCSFWKTR